MKKIFYLFLLLVSVCILWSCRTKEVIIPSRNHKLKVEDFECVAEIFLKTFEFNGTQKYLEWGEDEKYDIILTEYRLGDSVFLKYCTDALIYPEEMVINSKVGRVHITFGIKNDGNIDSVRVGKGFFPVADSVALEVVKNQPQKMWIPAHRKDGSFVYSEIIVAFIFRRK